MCTRLIFLSDYHPIVWKGFRDPFWFIKLLLNATFLGLFFKFVQNQLLHDHFRFQSFWLCASSIFDPFSFLCMTCQLSSSWCHYHLLNHHPKETVWSEKRLRLWLFNEHIQWIFVNLHYISSTQSEISVNLDQTVCDKFHWRSGIFFHKSTQHANLNWFDNIILSPVLLVGSFHNYIFSRSHWLIKKFWFCLVNVSITNWHIPFLKKFLKVSAKSVH